MAFVFTPTCPGTGPWYIDREDCIGDSLLYINANTGYLDCKISSLSATTNTQINNLSTVPYTRLNDGNQTGDAPIFGARAWVNFNGNGTIGTNQTIRAQGNVSSVYKNNIGDYTIYFTVPMPTTNYCVFGSGVEDNGTDTGPTHQTAISLARVADMLTTSIRVLNANIDGNQNVNGAVITVSVIC